MVKLNATSRRSRSDKRATPQERKLKEDAYAAQRRKGILLLLGLLGGLAAVLVLYSTPLHTERVEGEIIDQYGFPGRSGAAYFCRVAIADREPVLAACGGSRPIHQKVTVQITESYLFGARLNRVISP